MNYWLIKSEPNCYSIDDLKRDKTTAWSGVRNYQARNFIKQMKAGDLAIFYHSGSKGAPPAAVGIAKVIKSAYDDYTALDSKDDHYDPKATKDNPIWYMADFGFVEKFENPLSLTQIKFQPNLKGMLVTQQGSRLSVQPVEKKHFEIILKIDRSKTLKK